MKKLLLILILSISLTSYGRIVNKEELEYKNRMFYEVKEGVPYTGKVINHYKNGQIRDKATYKNGKLNGELIKYHENGKPIHIKFYKDGKLNGDFINYYENGQVIDRKIYKDGKQIK